MRSSYPADSLNNLISNVFGFDIVEEWFRALDKNAFDLVGFSM